ncbi:MAG: ribosome biosynthesis protein nip7 [Chaenotheca gracillima]|nr:MAG: ribosome biosynthesis protein nip7 [Chaenotheca gracillima]
MDLQRRHSSAGDDGPAYRTTWYWLDNILMRDDPHARFELDIPAEYEPSDQMSYQEASGLVSKWSPDTSDGEDTDGNSSDGSQEKEDDHEEEGKARPDSATIPELVSLLQKLFPSKKSNDRSDGDQVYHKGKGKGRAIYALPESVDDMLMTMPGPSASAANPMLMTMPGSSASTANPILMTLPGPSASAATNTGGSSHAVVDTLGSSESYLPTGTPVNRSGGSVQFVVPESPWRMDQELFENLPEGPYQKTKGIQCAGNEAMLALDAFETLHKSRTTYPWSNGKFSAKLWEEFIAQWTSEHFDLHHEFMPGLQSALYHWDNFVIIMQRLEQTENYPKEYRSDFVTYNLDVEQYVQGYWCRLFDVSQPTIKSATYDRNLQIERKLEKAAGKDVASKLTF